jgi:imidazolonepropionase
MRTRVDLGRPGHAARMGRLPHPLSSSPGIGPAEFVARMAGEPYAAGGIGVTVDATRSARGRTAARTGRDSGAATHVLGGTTCLETKTGYGLERRGARASQRRRFAAEVRRRGHRPWEPTWTPPGSSYRRLRRPGLRANAGRRYNPTPAGRTSSARSGAFDVDQSRQDLGLRDALPDWALRVHGNQLGHSGGVALAVEMSAASVDHCNYLSDGRHRPRWPNSDTVATVLPACDLSTRAPLAPARQLLGRW